MFKRTLLALASFALAASALHAQAQYPTKPVTVIVPFAAGGPTDTVARQVAAVMSKSLGQQVLIENVGGAGGTIGVGKVISAPNDGYTLLLMHIGISTAPALYRTLKYDATKDLEPIGLITEVPMTLVANNNFPPKDIKELLSYVKSNKDKVSYANAGLGSASHLCGMLFMSAIETDLLTVGYKGTAPAMTDLVGGTVNLMCDQTTNTTSQIKGKSIKAYAVTSTTRVGALPDLPTLNEAGLKGFNVGVWHGLWAPKGTAKPIIDKVNAALQAALKDDGVKAKFADLGTAPEPVNRQTPEALRAHQAAEVAKWGPIIKKAGVYAD
ncbi:MAG: tripartite tricarboxylate transporter substrate binding protein BugD [Betaproteobacteria bacterium]|nr:tripartite tricarboxylate transporter substrate binding protein BugD [Betaproteobacteria bacterium]